MEINGTPQRPKGDGDAHLNTSTDTGTSGQIMATATNHTPPGHHYENTTTEGNSRVQLGDQFYYHGGQHNHYHCSATTIDHAHGVTAKQLMDALSFPQMDFRYVAIRAAYRQTCQWLFDTAEYRRWRDPELRQAHHGLLWVKGKPGSGKSTITKVALQFAQKTYVDEKNLYFFFNGRGSILEKSVEGMFRSLLHQVVLEVPWLLEAVNARSVEAYSKGGWPLELLKNLFREAMHQLGRTVQVTCYIDALDEGDNDYDIRDMIEFLAETTESAVFENVRLSVYLASRHYPNISVPHSETLVLEDHGFHRQDIASFVQSKLNCREGALKEELTAEIVRRSSGVFLWVVLTVRLLNKESDQGNLYDLQSKFKAIPQELNSLFEGILREGASDERLFPAILWILYANRALRPEELYFAIRTSTNSLSATSVVWNHEVVDDTAIRNFVLSSSKGLVEIVPGNDSRKHSVQFIHDSVRSFLTTSGMHQIAFTSGQGVIGEHNVRLAQWCQIYLDLSFHSGAKRHLEYAIARNPLGSARHAFLDCTLLAIIPFLPYALDGILQHSEKAASYGTNVQIPFEDTLRSQLWLGLKGILKQPKSLPGLLHIFTHERCASLIGQELTHHLPVYINEAFLNDYQLGIGDMRGTALQIAVARHYCDITEYLLAKGAEVNTSCEGAPHPLHIVLSRYSWATKPQDMAMIEVLLHYGADTSASNEAGESVLHAAARIDSDVFEILLQNGADIDARDARGRTVLDVAVISRNLSIVKTCIARGASVNHGSRTLHAAIKLDAASQTKSLHAPLRTQNGSEIVELLLKSGADVNAKDASGKTALIVALECRSAVMIRTCMQHGADINANLENGDGILHIAAKLASDHEMADFLLQSGSHIRRDVQLIEFLIQSGAEIHAMNVDGMTPLDVVVATGGNSLQLARAYILHGAVVNAHSGPSLLRRAVMSMDIEMTKCILAQGVDMNACDVDGETLLYKLCREGDANTHTKAREKRQCSSRSNRLCARRTSALLKLVLEQGADVNRRNGRGETPLHAIAQRKSATKSEVELLLLHGADTEARDDQGNTAIQIAKLFRNPSVGRYIREANTTGTESPSTPQQTTSEHQTSSFHQ